jgi:HlyD family secretion protein
MDTNIEQDVLAARKKKVLLYFVAVLVLLAGLVLVLRKVFTTTLKRSQITTAIVERGDIENTINAAGEVLPEFEEVISSPLAASIQKVVKDAGTTITAGQSILTLDKSAATTEYEKLKFQFESKQNDIRKMRLELDKSYYDIKSSNNIKRLHINSLKAGVENSKRLQKAGGGTLEDIEQAELKLQVAQLEKKQLENEILNKQQAMRLEIREVELAARIQKSELNELARKLRLADIQAGRTGVVTWVNKNIGATIQPGEVIARIADLSSFKIKGTIADNFIDQLKNGMVAIIRINEIQLRGKVINIYPSVQNGTISFDILPDQKNSRLFRPNLKTDVFLITDKHSNVLRVNNGQTFKGTESEYLYLLRNGVAVRKLVHTGLSNFDYVELKDQVKAGDTVITSDMSEYRNTLQIQIKP